MGLAIDTTFDFLTETPPGKDADAVSPTLKRYHRHLWTKPLPSGPVFDLQERPGAYLTYETEGRTIYPASDAITTNLYGKAARIIDQIPPAEIPPDLGYTIGSSIIFPGERIGRQMTINGARGFHPQIADRFDLTLECIRRHYEGEESPLAVVLGRYGYFFDLFVDFGGYVEFFLLHDLLRGPDKVKFFMEFDEFQRSSIPQDTAEYLSYRAASDDFIRARNRRMGDFVSQLG
ncbi:DUF6994 family protein [Ornithinimicrobium pratense]|uniref:Uncharacterized protein n=1 Tax=Ornithinimicrobium pratense TaxID=2593973 RepID=A0A5J6V8C3_9MICO|nr:hypothetical protein [Ornithinimicrobium pratense]QFG69242.1 hypothetical protein FY030_11470 [Ornithinimicrobium pratense]